MQRTSLLLVLGLVACGARSSINGSSSQGEGGSLNMSAVSVASSEMMTSSSSSVTSSTATGCSGMVCAGVCTDTSSDPANCGKCGNDCQGAPCVDGACQGMVLTNASPRGLAVDDKNVYYADFGLNAI